ncbi:MAG TPA: tetratricopeptide repeat protein [Vicinamibacterales bacterium]|jgi:tetratricopeptide (TPR) repeat protein
MNRPVALLAVGFAATFAMHVEAQKIADQQSRREALVLYRTGQEFMSAERFDRAAEAFTDAVAKDSLLTVAHYGLGQAYMNLQRFASAIKAYKDCIEAMRALHGLQQTNQFEADKQRDDQIRELRGVLDRARQSARAPTVMALEQQLRDLQNLRTSIAGPFRAPGEVLLALGSAYFRNGDRDAAEVQWKAAIDANPKLGEAHNNLAVIYMQTERLDAAEEELKLAEKAGFRVNPQFKEDLKKRRAAR